MSDSEVKVLLVEDNPGDARLLRELLLDVPDASRFEIIHVDRLEKALTRLKEGGVDVILLDLSLPDGHGLETVTRATAAAPDVPLVILTGHADETLAIRAVQEGAQDYLVKGQVESTLVVKALRYAIERKQAQENARSLVWEQARRAEAESAARRSRFLAEASAALSDSLDQDTTLTTLARLAVPAIADACLLDLIDEGRDVRRSTVCALPQLEAVMGELAAFPPDLKQETAPIVRALTLGEPALVPELRDLTELAATPAIEATDLLRQLGPRAYITVPLIARGRTLGAVTLLAIAPDRDFGQDELELALELAGRAALAVDNARLYREAQQVVAIVSHDLRNPLNVVTMTVSILRQQRHMRDEQREKLLERIDRAASRMNRLIEDLLDATRIEAGLLSLNRTPQSVTSLVADAMDMLRPLAEEKSIRAESYVSGGLPEVVVDRERILQVISNLVGNAVKFTPSEGRILLRAEGRNDAVVVSVEDTGPGIPEEQLPHIFDRFWQGRHDSQGAGLGLAIAKGIINAHQGRLWVKSRPGQGTRFSFSLPLLSGSTARLS